MSYQPLNLNTAIHIDCIYTIHYFEYASDFTYKGERHDFWEFCYVDKGEIEVMAGKQTFLLKQGEVIFHEPNEFHSLKAANRTAPNIAVVSFGTHDAAMRFFAQRIFTIDNEERSFLANVINEARLVLDHPLNIPGQRRLYKKENIPFGAEQLTQMFIEMFLLHLQRRMLDPALLKLNLSTRTKENADEYYFESLLNYLEENLDQRLTLSKIAHDNLISVSKLEKLFKEKTQKGVIEYFSMLKIEKAKDMIRLHHDNFTQISEKLGYNSIHYFSRQFKKVTGLTPTEYALSIQALEPK
ncbi:MAG TPA: helix-turn-helix transcriptional regulator [Candidatus Fimiplasma intestinipullorum]|uniref:Helix-turn-helix transcriptional regulator n=1 Tax=Candidatus Fimiplasma intestinipullorum TaxID=2840825 RepID=A0A9D1HLL7_9FIRM|nr:helix-turn-helix transcriptional regulator [Candidatus Fimiplasma intestinipullorum]